MYPVKASAAAWRVRWSLEKLTTENLEDISTEPMDAWILANKILSPIISAKFRLEICMGGHTGHVGQVGEEEEEDFINFLSSFLISYLLEKIKKKKSLKNKYFS